MGCHSHFPAIKLRPPGIYPISWNTRDPWRPGCLLSKPFAMRKWQTILWNYYCLCHHRLTVRPTHPRNASFLSIPSIVNILVAKPLPTPNPIPNPNPVSQPPPRTLRCSIWQTVSRWHYPSAGTALKTNKPPAARENPQPAPAQWDKS